MENEQMSKSVETDNSQRTDGTDHSTQIGSTGDEITPDVKPEDSKGEEDDVSADESRDTTSRTSTRLVKFQLFETKAVSLNVVIHLISSTFIS
jgi:hypothetical protein